MKKSAKKTNKAIKPSASSTKTQRARLPTTETRLIYRPEDFALGVAKLFPKEKKDWKDTASSEGYLRIRPNVSLGIVGLCGSLSLGNPPSPEDVDAWEASKRKGCGDYWSFLDFISIPAEGKQGGLDVVLFHHRDSLQDRALEIVDRIHLARTSYELSVIDADDDFVEDAEDDEEKILFREWKRLRIALDARYGTASLRKQKWLVGEKVFDVTFPDE